MWVCMPNTLPHWPPSYKTPYTSVSTSATTTPLFLDSKIRSTITEDVRLRSLLLILSVTWTLKQISVTARPNNSDSLLLRGRGTQAKSGSKRSRLILFPIFSSTLHHTERHIHWCITSASIQSRCDFALRSTLTEDEHLCRLELSVS